MEQNNK